MTKTIILIGTGNLPIPSEKGAIEEIIWKVSLELAKAGFKVSIFNPISRNILSKLVKVCSLHQVSRDKKTLMHFHDLISCIIYCYMSYNSRNVILTLHYPPWITKTSRRHALMISALRYLKKKEVVFAAPSRIIVSWLQKVIKGKAFLLPNGVDTSLFNPSKRRHEIRERILGDKDILISYVARVHPDKNQLDLLRAVNILVNERSISNFKVVFIGPLHGTFSGKRNLRNEYYLNLKYYIKENRLENYVSFLGELGRKKEVAYFLANSDIYVHLSLIEASPPLAIMEAMASGLPIIAYDLIYYDFLKNNENAILIKRGNLENLVNALETLINDESTRKNLGRNARIFAEENLSWKKIVEGYYIKLYEIFQ
jgi:glycosyltransferase involved in cell wall biosynthesis